MVINNIQKDFDCVNKNNFKENFSIPIDVSSISNLLLRIQRESGDIPWHESGKTDPWDHVESAMGLAIAGRFIESARAFKWLKKSQLIDGSWYSSYKNGEPYNRTRETNMIAYIAVGVFHYWLITADCVFLETMWETVYKAITFVVEHQGPNGEIYWAISPKGEVDTTALLTASSSVFMSLKCAIAISYELNMNIPQWNMALEKLREAISCKRFLFDASKSRFSMDWFYPILCGAISGSFAFERINRYWGKFVVENLGVKCVADQPWVTIAESSELALSLSAIGMANSGKVILEWISKRVFEDGTFWCGFTFPDITLWPIEKISWTNAALLIATDALYSLTSASNIFNHNWWKSNYDAL